jgi:hypothetical protein
MRLDPHGCDPRREVWTLAEIGYDHGRGAQKRRAVMGDQRERYRVRVEILIPQATRDKPEGMAGIPPPSLPDAVGNGVEKFRSLSQVGDSELKGHGLIEG